MLEGEGVEFHGLLVVSLLHGGVALVLQILGLFCILSPARLPLLDVHFESLEVGVVGGEDGVLVDLFFRFLDEVLPFLIIVVGTLLPEGGLGLLEHLPLLPLLLPALLVVLVVLHHALQLGLPLLQGHRLPVALQTGRRLQLVFLVAEPAEVLEVLGDALPVPAPHNPFMRLSLLSLLGLLPAAAVLTADDLQPVDLLGGDPVFSEGLDLLADEFGFDEKSFKILLVDVHNNMI